MRASAPGQSALLMADVAESLARRGVRYAVIGAMAAAVHGVVRASLDADAIVALKVRESLDLELLRRLARRFGRDAERVVGDLIGAADE